LGNFFQPSQYPQVPLEPQKIKKLEQNSPHRHAKICKICGPFAIRRFAKKASHLVLAKKVARKAHFTRNNFAHNIMIKRYCNEIIKRHYFSSKYCS